MNKDQNKNPGDSGNGMEQLLAWDDACLGFIPEDLFDRLGTAGKMLAKYWCRYLPEMSRELAAKDKFLPLLFKKSNDITLMAAELIRGGASREEVLQSIGKEVYALPPEGKLRDKQFYVHISKRKPKHPRKRKF